MKKFRVFAIVFAFITLFAGIIGIGVTNNSQVQAANIKDENIVYQSVDKTIDISDEKVCDITETIVVQYRQSGINVGLTRNVSRKNKITRLVNGKKYQNTTENKFKLNSVTVNGEPEFHFTQTDSEYFYIMTGSDFDFKDAGIYEYKFNYTLDMGEDFIKDFDDFTFDIMDYDFGSKVGKFSASITLPDSFTTSDGSLTFRTNRMSPLSPEALNTEINGRTIKCHFDRGIAAGNGITMQLILPNKYFNTKFTPSPFYYVVPVVCIVSIVGMFILILFCLYTHYSKRGIVVTPEFYPPKGYSPLDVARCYRGKIKSKDFASLILSWTSKKLVSLEFISKKDILLTKLADYPELDKKAENYKAQRLEKEYFEAMFKKKKTYSTKSIADNTLDVSGAATKLYDYDDDTKKSTKICRNIGHVLAMLPWIFYILWFGIWVHSGGFVMLFITIFITIGTFVFLYVTMPILFKLIWCGGFTGIPIAMLCIMGFQSIYDINGYATLAFVLFFVLHFVARCLNVRSKKYDAHRGEVLGFKKFLEKVEVAELETLINDNPEYYYDILPYCYVFGITKKMEKKFTSLHVPAPTYCESGFTTTMLYVSLARSIYHSYSHSASAKSGSFGGFGGGGGGGSHGSSGGGGGGGGCHGR